MNQESFINVIYWATIVKHKIIFLLWDSHTLNKQTKNSKKTSSLPQAKNIFF